MNAIKCFAWLDNDPRFGLDLYSISETEKGVRTEKLIESMSWRYIHGGHNEEWQWLLTFGRIVPVTVSLLPPSTPKEETETYFAHTVAMRPEWIRAIAKAASSIRFTAHNWEWVSDAARQESMSIASTLTEIENEYIKATSPKEETEAMICELRAAGGSDLDNVVEVSEATDGTAIG